MALAVTGGCSSIRSCRPFPESALHPPLGPVQVRAGCGPDQGTHSPRPLLQKAVSFVPQWKGQQRLQGPVPAEAPATVCTAASGPCRETAGGLPGGISSMESSFLSRRSDHRCWRSYRIGTTGLFTYRPLILLKPAAESHFKHIPGAYTSNCRLIIRLYQPASSLRGPGFQILDVRAR